LRPGRQFGDLARVRRVVLVTVQLNGGRHRLRGGDRRRPL